MSAERRMALVASPTPQAQEAAQELRGRYEWVPLEQADTVVALGGDGFLLSTLHQMLDRHRAVPVFGMNLGTVGFLMNEYSPDLLENRISGAKTVRVSPLRMDVVTMEGERISTLTELYRKVWSLGHAGVEVPLTLHRDGLTFEVRVNSSDRAKLLKAPRMH